MSRINLYVHYDSVTNYILTRAINLLADDFEPRYLPTSMILADACQEFGRLDPSTNFKILRTQGEVIAYFDAFQSAKIRLSNWIDFDNIESMHQLNPNEISEILYLFHANKPLKSAFFYKLQNNYVFLTQPNGLIKVYYRYINHFYPRFKRVVRLRYEDLINESQRFFFMKKTKVASMDDQLIEEIAPLFSSGVKVNFEQAIQAGSYWRVPLNIIEDNLTLLTQNQLPKEHIGFIIYDTNSQKWSLDLELYNANQELEEV